VGQDFEAAYTALLARWPQPVQALDIDTQLGRTRVHSAGPPEAPPMLLVSGGGACSPVWADVANALVPARRVLALDVPGDAGMSASPTRKPRNPAEVAHWLEEVLGALALGVSWLTVPKRRPMLPLIRIRSRLRGDVRCAAHGYVGYAEALTGAFGGVWLVARCRGW